MEERYWQIIKTLDREGYIALWDDSFVGWPNSLPDPVRTDSIRADPFALLQGLKLKNIQLETKAVQVFGDVALAYYVAIGTYEKEGGGIEVEALRVHHVWRKNNRGWLIIGGMTAPAQPSKAE